MSGFRECTSSHNGWPAEKFCMHVGSDFACVGWDDKHGYLIWTMANSARPGSLSMRFPDDAGVAEFERHSRDWLDEPK